MEFVHSEEIDYPQLYAQVLHELRELKIPYWFNHAEMARIQDLNRGYMEQKDMAEIVQKCDHSTRIHLGLAMKELGYERTERGNVAHYKAIPRIPA